jgi:hypothetical protein
MSPKTHAGPTVTLSSPQDLTVGEVATIDWTYGGSPYLDINVGSIPAGGSVYSTLTFNQSSVSYTPSFYTGSLGS